MKHLSILGIAAGVGLIYFGHHSAAYSDARIIGYILLAPSLFAAYRKYGGPSLSKKGVGTALNAPNDGASLPSRRSQDSQITFRSGKMDPRTFGVPMSGSVRFGGLAEGGDNITMDSTAEVTLSNDSTDFTSPLSPPGSRGQGNFKRGW